MNVSISIYIVYITLDETLTELLNQRGELQCTFGGNTDMCFRQDNMNDTADWVYIDVSTYRVTLDFDYQLYIQMFFNQRLLSFATLRVFQFCGLDPINSEQILNMYRWGELTLC